MLMKSQTYIKLVNFEEGQGSSSVSISAVNRWFVTDQPKFQFKVYFDRATLKHTIKLELVMNHACT